MDDKTKAVPESERTATDDMVDRYRNGAQITPITRDPADSEPTGLPDGMEDSDKSPVAPI